MRFLRGVAPSSALRFCDDPVQVYVKARKKKGRGGGASPGVDLGRSWSFTGKLIAGHVGVLGSAKKV